ncbi:MAG: type VI secretion system baseplate subunit TssK [Desulfovibrionales bacterium]|nr:MAG: type VI secretion system baseplate subunit TssK [Desulfovibrionales bacterium]
MMADGPIYWHQGLFLQPQHFQILNQQFSETLAPLVTNLIPYFWGVAGLKVNDAALAAGRFELAEIMVLLPTTAQVLHVPGNAVCGGRQLVMESIPVDGSLTVYVGLRAMRPGEPNVTVAESLSQMVAAPTRLAVPVEPESVPDGYGDGPPAQIRRMSYVLNVVFENELDQAGDLDLVPIARLTREGDRAALDATFVPPCLTLSGSAALAALLKELRDRVLGKARQLEGYKNLSGGVNTEFTLLLMALRTLSRFAARLDHAVENHCLSPWNAYGMLRELVAELSVFSLDISALGENWQDERLVPDYAHTDLGRCFRGVRDVIVSLLEGISAGPRFVTRFEFKDPSWTAEIPNQILAETRTSGGEYWLVLHSELMDPQTMRESASQMLKLSATSAMGSLLVRALPGIPLAASDSPPAGMPRRHGAIYFRIGRESPLWSEIEKNGSIALHWTEAPEDLDAQLAVLTR